MKKCVIKFHKFYLFFLVFSLFLPRFVFAEILPSWKDENAYKPSPVLFLHGFALGNSSSWNYIKSQLNQYLNDYSLTSTFLETINFNDPNGSIDTYDPGKYNPQGNSDGWADKLKTEIEELINEYRFKESSLKINLVCHSMGGLAAREFLTNPKYGNLYLNIDKMVTIGTPHAGTPLANVNKVKDVLTGCYKYVWEVPYYGKTKALRETSTEGEIVKIALGIGIDFEGEALKDMAINSPFLMKLKDSSFPVNIKKLAIYGIGTNNLSIGLNKTFFGIYYKDDPFLSGDGIVPRHSQIGYDIMSNYPNSASWVWKPDSINKTPADHFEELKAKQTVDSVVSFLDSTPPECTLDTPQAGSTTEISTNSISIKGKVYKEYLPADSEIIIKVSGAALNQINAPLKPSSLWIPNNPDSPVAEFDETLAFPGQGTYKIFCQIQNPAGMTSDTKVFWVKVILPQPNANIIVHCHNPEGKEIAGIQGVGQRSVEIYDGATLIGYGAYDANTHNKLISIPSGSHTIKAKFNGMVLEQNIDILGGTTQELTFTFTRTSIFNTEMLTLSETESNTFTSNISFGGLGDFGGSLTKSSFYGHAWGAYGTIATTFLSAMNSINVSSWAISAEADCSVSGDSFLKDLEVVNDGLTSKNLGIPLQSFSRWYAQNYLSGDGEVTVEIDGSGFSLTGRYLPVAGYIFHSYPASTPFGWGGFIEFSTVAEYKRSPTFDPYTVKSRYELASGFRKVDGERLKFSSVPYAVEDL